MVHSMGHRAKIFIKGLLSLILLLCFIAPAFAGQWTVPTFTDKDLEKYKYPSERNTLTDPEPPRQSQTEDKQSKDVGHEEQQKLRKYEVPYKAHEGTVKRILLPVTFNNSVTAQMLLDTGATGTNISLRLAEKLGIFRKDEGKLLEAISGVGGTVPAILTIIDSAKIGEAEDNFIPTTISGSISEEFEGLIGMDFMTNFTIKIDTRKHIVTFEELPSRADMPGGHDETWWREKFHEFASKRADWKSKRDAIYDRYSFSGASEPAAVLRREGKMTTITIQKMEEFVDYQYEEADKLLRKLDGYAVDHGVPMEWREY
jgi:predicted aspartyl protease